MIDYTGSCGAQGCEHWAHADARGTIVATADETGAKRDIYTYATYGAPAEAGGVPFRYTGQKYDEDAGLYHYKARFFDAETGRFVSPDPIRYGDGMNLYAYVGNDPMNIIDPSGEFGVALALIGPTAASLGGQAGIDAALFLGTLSEVKRNAYIQGIHSTRGAELEALAPRIAVVKCQQQPETCGGSGGADADGDGFTDAFFDPNSSGSDLEVGFPPGHYCYQNSDCSGRANAGLELDIALALAGVKGVQLGGKALRSAAPAAGRALGPAGPVFGRGGKFGRGRGVSGGFLNSNNIARVGFGFNGQRQVFRSAFGRNGARTHIHFDLFPPNQIGVGGKFRGTEFGFHPFRPGG